MYKTSSEWTFNPMAAIRVILGLFFAVNGYLSWYIFVLFLLSEIDLKITRISKY